MLLLRGGEVIDGTGAPRRRGDVLCNDAGQIERVGTDLPAGDAEVVDCGGLCVTPGFIDTHAHTDLAVFAAPDLPMKLRQGVTLDIVGQDGLSVVPVEPARASALQDEQRWLLGDAGPVAGRLSTVGEYLAALDAAPAGIGVGYLCPHGALRTLAMGPGAEQRAPTEAELGRMCAALEAALREGALGLSTGLIYPPCLWAGVDELVALCRVVARAGGVFAVHLRSESGRVLEAADEMLEVARRSGVHLHVSHLKILGRTNWGLIGPLIDKLAGARGELTITGDQYPYTASSTTLAQLLPDFVQAGGTDAAVARLTGVAERQAIRDALAADQTSAWQRTGPEAILIADVPSGRRPEVVGKTIAAAAGAAGQGADPLGFVLDLLRDERLSASMITFSQDEAVVERVLGLPWVNLCTDGLIPGRPHPRTYGAFPRVLGRYVRERGVLGLEEAVRKMTSQAADAMHIASRGRVAPGLAADLVVLDPARVIDRSTYEDPVQFPAGIEHVVVGGRFAVRAAAPTGLRAGAVIRRGMHA